LPLNSLPFCRTRTGIRLANLLWRRRRSSLRFTLHSRFAAMCFDHARYRGVASGALQG
jgi:hypothetical protein